MQPDPKSFEKLGAFYLGRAYDAAAGRTTDELILYDAKDLTTHAVCVGMTGSGKTGLCISLLEEAAIDGIPAIAIDPKGDLGNLMLTFPELRGADFRPWVDEAEAVRKGLSPDDFAGKTAETWRAGLEEWGEDGARIARFRAAADVAIYTPGSSAGLPLTVLRSFAAPGAALAADADALRERIGAAVAGLLALLGVDADPIQSREQILLATLFDRAWRAGRDLDLGALVREIQSPPFDAIGVVDLESFYPAKERFALAIRLNNLLASPAFAAWREGEPLDVARLLWTREGRPRLSILSIAHLSDAERMFFVTILLNEIIAWMRAQPGTSSLRALLYMDEIFGYFPPTANPPSKTPMLTLLKQARAYGLGVVLATQNPVDLDYKGLSNAGTWFLGRLQTERDKSRVLEGLEGASAAAGARFDRGRMEATLAGLKNRVFLMNNVHDDEPVLFESRWAMSYLRGPLTRAQIGTLMAARKAQAGPGSADVVAPPDVSGSSPSPTLTDTAAGSVTAVRPVLPPQIPEFFLHTKAVAGIATPTYRPALLGSARVGYFSAKAGVDQWDAVNLLATFSDDHVADPWEPARDLGGAEPALTREPLPGAHFWPLPQIATHPESYRRWSSVLADYLYRARPLTLWSCAAPKATSKPGESEGDFKARLSQRAREGRDATIESLKARFAPRLSRLQDKIQAAEERVVRERSQSQNADLQTAISVGATVLGAFLGRRIASVGNIGRATTAMRGASRAAREKRDVGRAAESLEELRQELLDLEVEFQSEATGIQGSQDAATVESMKIFVRPRKSDVSVIRVALVWVL